MVGSYFLAHKIGPSLVGHLSSPNIDRTATALATLKIGMVDLTVQAECRGFCTTSDGPPDKNVRFRGRGLRLTVMSRDQLCRDHGAGPYFRELPP